MSEGVFDLRFAICDLATGGRNPRSRHDGGQFADEFQHPQRKPFCSFLKFLFCHNGPWFWQPLQKLPP